MSSSVSSKFGHSQVDIEILENLNALRANGLTLVLFLRREIILTSHLPVSWPGCMKVVSNASRFGCRCLNGLK